MDKKLTKNETTDERLKGQVATEFFLYASVFILIVIAAFVSLSYIQTTEIPTREATLAKEVGEDFANAINLAVGAGKGFRYDYSFSKTIIGKKYIIIFDETNSRLAITWQGTYNNFTYAYPLASYDYEFDGCINDGDKKLVSDECKNKIRLFNDGEKLVIIQEA